MTDWIIKPSGDSDLSNAELVPDTGLPQRISGVEAGLWDVGRIDWNTSNPVEVYPDDSNISGTGPVLAALEDGDQLSIAVTWGSYSSPEGSVTTTRQMRVGSGAWVAYVGNTGVAEDETWRVREIAADNVSSRVFTSGSQVVASAVLPPAITSVVFDGDADPMTLSFSVDRDATVYWAWVDSATPKTGAELFDIVDQDDGDFIHGSVAMVTGINYPTIDDQPTGSGEYWLQFVAKADGLYSTVQVIGPVDAIQVGLFSETWTTWSAGATEANLLLGGWSPGGPVNTAPPCLVIVDADAPQGKSLSLPRTATESSSGYFISRDDIDAALAEGWTSLDVVALLRVPTKDFSRAFISMRDEDFTGILTLEFVDWSGVKVVCSANGASNLASVTAPTIAQGDIAWARVQLFDGNKARGKAWTGAIGDEPASWANTKTGSTWSTFVAPRLGIHLTNARSHYAGVLGFWVGIDRDAEVPSW